MSTGERTQRPTERRRREARARGDVPRSAELVSAAVLLSATAGLWWGGPSLAAELAGLMRSSLSAPPPASVDPAQVTEQFVRLAQRLSTGVLPILLATAVAATIASLVQTGWMWVPSRVVPQWERLDAGRNFGRWSAPGSWVSLAGSMARLAVLGAVLVVYVQNRLTSAGPLSEGTAQAQLLLSARLIGELAAVLSATLVILAILDFGFRFWQHERQLMMTPEEVRREQREDEGNRHWSRSRGAAPATGAPAAGAEGVQDVRPV